MDGVTLRIFSGLHLGAEIELQEGVYVVGSDDSCDLILSDSSLAPRHAALHILLPESGTQVTAEPLDGKVLLSGEALPGEERLPARYPFQLGQIVLAWTEAASADNAAWQEVEERLARAKKTEETERESENAPAPQPTTLPDEAEDKEKDANETAPSSSLPELEEGGGDKAEKNSGRSGKTFKAAGILLACALAGLLCFTWEEKAPQRTPEELMRSLLDEAGYQKLSVTGGKNSVTVSGRIASDRERGRLLRLAQLL